MKRVVVGLSGGVDSSVSAYLLKEQGYEVIGMFMKNWHDESVTLHNECPWIEDSNDALIVAERLGIPFKVIDFSKEYKSRIVDYMFREYEQGRTPNPDVLCNREIKFDVFLKAAEKLGADFVATGHYCRKDTILQEGQEVHRLLAGKDPSKDQSYFLCQLTQAQLSKALFPIGHLLKSEVRRIAKEANLITAEKRDSQGLCFVGKIKLPDFLQQQLLPKKGLVVEVPEQALVPAYPTSNILESLPELCRAYHFEATDGQVIGKHNGAHFYTIGQRKGLQIGGKPKPLFVVATDVQENIIYVGQGQDHWALQRKGLSVRPEEVHWVRPDLRLPIGGMRSYLVRIRYRQPLVKATLHQEAEALYVIFEDAQTGVTPGQFVAWYDHEELVGSGVIA